MLSEALTIAGKDINLVLFRGQGFLQACLFGLLLVFVFSLASAKSGPIDRQWISAIFWLASCFALILVFNTLYGLEEENGSKSGLILAPIPLQSIWLGKALAGYLLLLLVQALFIPACVVFLGVQEMHSWTWFLVLILLLDWGLVVLGSLLGAIGQGGRDSLLAVIVFPLLIPLLLAGIRLGGSLLQQYAFQADFSWLRLIGAFDALFTGAALILFPFIYSE